MGIYWGPDRPNSSRRPSSGIVGEFIVAGVLWAFVIAAILRLL